MKKMKFFSNRFNFKSMRQTMIFLSGGAILLITLSTMNGCTQSDRSTESRDEVIEQNALEAEAAEAQMAPKAGEEKVVASHETHDKPTPKKVAHAETKPRARKPASAGGVFVVQVGAFKVKENAERLHQKLSSAGYQVETQMIEHSKNGTLHLVRFHPTSNRAEAQTMIEDLQTKHNLQAQIVTVPATATH